MLYLSANREMDQAFRVADAFFFGRGFAIAAHRFTPEQGTFDNRRRRTAMLFERATAPMRSDPRFASLTASLGVEQYWRLSGNKPDYRA
jgi:hypothetical protein